MMAMGTKARPAAEPSVIDLPVIDVSSCCRASSHSIEATAKLLVETATTYGFVYVKNNFDHILPASQVDDMFEVVSAHC